MGGGEIKRMHTVRLYKVSPARPSSNATGDYTSHLTLGSACSCNVCSVYTDRMAMAHNSWRDGTAIRTVHTALVLHVKSLSAFVGATPPAYRALARQSKGLSDGKSRTKQINQLGMQTPEKAGTYLRFFFLSTTPPNVTNLPEGVTMQEWKKAGAPQVPTAASPRRSHVQVPRCSRQKSACGVESSHPPSMYASGGRSFGRWLLRDMRRVL